MRQSSQMGLRRLPGDTACSWEVVIGGSQGMETVKTSEAGAIVGML